MNKPVPISNKLINSVCVNKGGLLHVIDLNMKLMIQISKILPAFFKAEPWIRSWFLDTNQFLMKIPYHLNYKDLEPLLEPSSTEPWINRLQFLSIYNDYDANVHSINPGRTHKERAHRTVELIETYMGGISKIYGGCLQIRKILIGEHPTLTMISNIIPQLDTIIEFLTLISKDLNINISKRSTTSQNNTCQNLNLLPN